VVQLVLIVAGIVIITAIFMFFVSYWGIFLGIGLFIFGGYLLERNEKKETKSKWPGAVIVLALLFLTFGIVSAFTGDDKTADSKDEEVKSSEVVSVSTEEKDKAKTEEKEKQEAEEKKAKEQRKQKAKAEKKAAEKKAQAEKANAEQEAKEKAEKEAKAKAAAEAKKKKESQTNATVTRVIDGDTIEINYKGRTEDVRLLLIDTPETVHPSKPVEPFGPEASQFVKDTLTGEKVRIKVGSEERDRYDRLLAYVFINGTTIQEMLFKKGLAATAYLYNDLTMLDQFHKAQKPAREAGIGVWSIPGYAHVDHDHGYHYKEEPEPKPKQEEKKKEPSTGINTNVPDKDCGDFSTHAAAQAFMDASGPGDPHRLDGNDNDGLACESLP
jgi:micrococcal nuclease